MLDRRSPVRLARALVLVVALTGLVAPAAVAADPSADPSQQLVSDRIIVAWEADAARTERVSARSDAETALVRTLSAPEFQLVRPQAGQTVADALSELRSDPAVLLAVRDGYSVLHATTNDPLFGELWGLQNLGVGIGGFFGAVSGADADVPAGWDRTRGIPSVVIADLDSGFRFDHPDLGPVAWSNPADPQDGVDNDGNGIVDDSHGADFVGPSASASVLAVDGDPTDDNGADGGHGVHTAGTMAAAGNNGVGISGVAQDVRIMPLRVCSFSWVAAEMRCPTSSQIDAINYAGAHGARAANMSLGGRGAPNPAVLAAFAANPHVLFVISAGNDTENNDARPHWPCNYNPATSGIAGAIDNIVCVAATDQADQLADFSDWGATSVDLAAPGTETLSTHPDYVEQSPLLSENFQGGDFGTRWTPSGAGFGTSVEAPLTSTGITDSPGRTPTSGALYSVALTAGIAIPAGVDGCRLAGSRFVSEGSDGDFVYSLGRGGEAAEFDPFSTGGSTMRGFSSGYVPVRAGDTLRLRFDYTAPTAPGLGNGVWLDDLSVVCTAAVSSPLVYEYLDGTSMAAPHVTGAAGLLFSLNASATVSQVRTALLATVDPLPALAGRTVTGGRLNVAAALAALPTPPPPAPPAPPAPPIPPLARAASTCRVPRLKGLSLRRAKRALRRAHCALGRVVKPRARRGRRLPPLVVKSSRPRAGLVLADGARVALTLKVKPRPRRRGRRR